MRDNIDKASARCGEYVGYADSSVWRIAPIVVRGARGALRRYGWNATRIAGDMRAPYTQQSRTLAELSAKLERLDQ